MLEIVQSGGWLMVPILLCSIIAAAISVERLWTLQRSRMTPKNLLAQVWGNCLCIGKRTVDVHIRKLRMALEGTHSEGWVQTVRSGGYRFSPAEDIEPTDGATFEYTGREREALAPGR